MPFAWRQVHPRPHASHVSVAGRSHVSHAITACCYRPCSAWHAHHRGLGLLSPSGAGADAQLVHARPSPCKRNMRVLASSAASSSGAHQPESGGSQAAAFNPFLRVVLPTGLALLLCNMDRICLSVAILPMSREFGWPESMQGIVQSAFLWGYMATQLLGGTLADRYGGKAVLAAGMVWFSLASMLLPLALSEPVMAAGLGVPAVLAARCLVGLGEGVALPAMNNLVASYVPKEAKARALGLAFTGFHCGNLLGLLLSPLLLMAFGWRALFCIFGIFGAPLLAMWLAVVPDKAPASQQLQQSGGGSSSSSSSSSKGSSKGSNVTPLDLLSKPATWAIIIVNIINHWGYFIYLNWMPTYFNKVLGFDLRASSFMAFVPWLVMALGSSLSGIIVDSLISRGTPVLTVRRAVQTIAFAIPALALMVLSQPGITPQAAVACMTVALGTTSLGQAGFVANMSDIAPKQAGKMFGLCNTFGSLSGIVGVTAVGFIVEATGSFNTVFQMTAAMYLVGVLVWNLLSTAEPVFD